MLSSHSPSRYAAITDGTRGIQMVQWDHNGMSTRGQSAALCDDACGRNTVSWSIRNPSCRAVSTHWLLGPLLGDTALFADYLSHVRRFVAIFGDPALMEEMQALLMTGPPYIHHRTISHNCSRMATNAPPDHARDHAAPRDHASQRE